MAARDYFRAHARRRVDLAGTLHVHDGSADATGRRDRGLRQTVRIRDLGLGGTSVEIQEVTSLLTEREVPVMIEVLAPMLWDPLILRGKVAWIKHRVQGKGTRAGVRFEHHDAAALYALFQLLGTQTTVKT